MTNTPAPPPAARYADPDDPSSALLFDLESDVLPSGITAEVKPILGVAERAYRAIERAKGAATVDKMADFLALCLVKLDGEAPGHERILDLRDEDVRALFLRIRRASFVESTEMPFSWTCAPPFTPRGGGCGHENADRAVDLASLPFDPLPTTSGLVLPVAKKAAAWSPVTLRSQKEYAARRRTTDDSGVDLDVLLLNRKVQIDGKALTSKQADEMHPTDKSALRKALLTAGGVNVIVEDVCAGCGYVMQRLADHMPGFFFPEMVGR